MKNWIEQKKNTNRFIRGGHLARRLLASMLTCAMLLPTCTTAFALSDPTLVDPIQVIQPENEFPHIEIQGNVVKDSAGELTGYFELGLRVQTPLNKSFRSVSVTLEYDSSVLMPVSWEDTTGTDLTTGVTTPYGVQLPTKKYDKITGAVAQSAEGVSAGAPAAPDQDPGPAKAQLFFNAESYKDVSFEDMTTLAVIRFYVKSEKKFTLQTTGIDETILYGGEATTLDKFVTFAPDATIKDTRSPIRAALMYAAGDNAFYFVPSYDGTDTTTTNIPKKVGGAEYQLPAPTTANLRVLAHKADPAEMTSAPATYYSYLSNHLSKTNVTFKLVSQESFSQSGVDIDNLSTILFYDWDDTLIGVLTVPKGEDVRENVNEYVKKNMIHTELQSNSNTSSIKRTDNYRGRYPHSGPGASGGTVTDGGKFPLTYKLDYAFFKRPMVEEMDTTTDPDNPVPTGKWVQATGDLAWDTTYPYTHGWALCEKGKIESTWTTLGVGELSKYEVAAEGGASFTVADDMPFTFADFKSGLNDPVTYVKAVYEPGDRTEFDGISTYSINADALYYGQYGGVPSAETGTAYVIRIQYERVMNGRGVRRTRDPAVRAQITPDLSETEKKPGDPFFLKVGVENVDIVDAEINPASEVYSVGYSLIDCYDGNFATGTQRSAISLNELNIYGNFDYEEFPLREDRFGTNGFVFWGVYQHLLEAAVEAVEPGGDSAELGLLKKVDILKDLNFKRTDGTPPGEYTLSYQVIQAFDKLEKLFKVAYDKGGADAVLALDWHQLQYHLLTCASDGTGGAIDGNSIRSAMDCINLHGSFDWCRLHGADGDCANSGVAGDELEITNWAQLLDAAYAANTNTNALKKLTADMAANTFWFAKDSDGALCAAGDLGTLKVGLKSMVNAANEKAGTPDAYKALTWSQVQYYLLNSNALVDVSTADAEAQEKYWWVNDGKKVEDIATLLVAADRANIGVTTPDNKSYSEWPADLKTATVDMDKVSNAPLRLRKSNVAEPTDGTPFADSDAFEADIKALVRTVKTAAPTTWNDATAGLGNWDILQYDLIHGYDSSVDVTTMHTEAEGYWWRYGNQVKDWLTLMEAADAYADGTDERGLLLGAVPATLLTDQTAGIWLRKNEDGDEFTTDMSTFVDAIKKIADKVHNNSEKMSENATWAQVQYMIEEYVRTNDVTYPVVGDVDTKVKDYYWWKDGGEGVTDLTTLIGAAQTAVDGNGLADLSSVKHNGVPAELRAQFDGTKYTADNIESFKSDMKNLMGALPAGITADDLTWSQVQYYLLHKSFPGAISDIDLEAQGNAAKDGYYWWTPEGWATVGNKVTIETKTPMATGGTFDPSGDTARNALNDAMFRGGINKNEHAWDDMTNNTTAENLRLIQAKTDGATADKDLTFATAAMVKERLNKLAANIVQDYTQDKTYHSGISYNAANKRIRADWYVMQYAVLNDGALVPDADTYNQIVTDYWWLKKNDIAQATATAMDTFADIVDSVLAKDPAGTTNTSTGCGQIKALLTNEVLDALNLSLNEDGSKMVADSTSTHNNAKNYVVQFLRCLINNTSGLETNKANGYDPDSKTLNITWYQLQYMMVKRPNATTGTIPSAAEAFTTVTGWAGWTSGKIKPPAGIPTTAGTPGADSAPIRVKAERKASLDNLYMVMSSFEAEPEAAAPAPVVTTETQTSEDGLTKTTKTTTKTYNEETGDWDTEIKTVSVTRVEAGETAVLVTVTNTTRTAMDPETGEWITTVDTTTETADAPAETEPPVVPEKPGTVVPPEGNVTADPEIPAEGNVTTNQDIPTGDKVTTDTDNKIDGEGTTAPSGSEEEQKPTQPEGQQPEEGSGDNVTTTPDNQDGEGTGAKDDTTDQPEGSGATNPDDNKNNEEAAPGKTETETGETDPPPDPSEQGAGETQSGGQEEKPDGNKTLEETGGQPAQDDGNESQQEENTQKNPEENTETPPEVSGGAEEKEEAAAVDQTEQKNSSMAYAYFRNRPRVIERNGYLYVGNYQKETAKTLWTGKLSGASPIVAKAGPPAVPLEPGTWDRVTIVMLAIPECSGRTTI